MIIVVGGKKADCVLMWCLFFSTNYFSATLFNFCMSDDGWDKAHCIPPHSPHPLKPNKLQKFHVHFRPPPARSGKLFQTKIIGVYREEWSMWEVRSNSRN